MSCIDLSNNSHDQTQHLSGLCAVCQGIDFVALTSKADQKVANVHYHLGKLRNIARKQFCPFCRLILSIARPRDPRHEHLDGATIDIQQRFSSSCIRASEGHRLFTYTMHGVGFGEVKLNGRVAGTIIRTEDTGPADPSGQKPTISESKEPISRRQVVPPEVNVSFIKQLMQSCNVQHEPCHLPTLTIAKELDIRLIDVQDHRIISATLAEHYVALSYVWGSTTMPSLIRDTISQFSFIDGLKDFIFPRTIKDAIHLVKCIGMRYLWVDSLCIVQDDDSDRQQQLTIMDSIYSGAKLLVVAAAGSDANAGLPGIGSTPRRISQKIEEINGIQFITAEPSVQQALKLSVWNSRGWTFQEAVLSRRALVFTESLVYWCCQVDTFREGTSSWSPIGRVFPDMINSLWPQQLRDWKGRDPEDRACRTSMYCILAEDFSRRALKEQRDVIWAFIGILKMQTSQFKKGFIWGLPYEKLDATLLWSETSQCACDHSRDACHSVIRKNSLYDLPYPSWSWLSTNTQVSFVDSCGASIVSEVTWHEPLKFADETSNAYLKSISLKGRSDRHKEIPSNGLLTGSKIEREFMDYGFLHFTAQTAVFTLKKTSGTRTLRYVMRALILMFVSLKRMFITSLALAMKSVLGRAIVNGDKADRDREKALRGHWVKASIHSHQGKQIGMLRFPSQFFNGNSKRAGEFVLLSSNAEKSSDGECKEINAGADCGSFEHVKGCKHIQSRNVMLIEREGEVAYRLGVGRIDKESWDDVKTEMKTIVLG